MIYIVKFVLYSGLELRHVMNEIFVVFYSFPSKIEAYKKIKASIETNF